MNEAPSDVARRGYECWAAGDYDGMLELTTPDFEFVPAIAAAVEGGSIRGHDAFRRFCDRPGRDMGNLPDQCR